MIVPVMLLKEEEAKNFFTQIFGKKLESVQKLGSGSFGVVYKVKLKNSGKDKLKEPIGVYAIKVIEAESVINNDINVLKEEYKKLKKCCPSCIVQVYPHLIGETNWEGKRYILIGADYIPNKLDIIKNFPSKERLEILLKLALCLYNLASNGFIYTDLKPQNVGLTEDRNPVILDLGGIQYFKPKKGNFETTLKYAPPEWRELIENYSEEELNKLLSKEKEDKKGLVYILGVLLEEFLKEEEKQLLEDLIKKATQKEREKRPTLEELLSKLNLVFSVYSLVGLSFGRKASKGSGKNNNTQSGQTGGTPSGKKTPKIPLKQFAYAFHSECGIVLDNEGLKGNILYGTNFSSILKNGQLWESWVLSQFNPLLYWNFLPFTNGGNSDLNSTLGAFINYIKNFPQSTFYLYGVPIDIRGIVKNLSLNQLEKKYISRFSPKVFIDLLEVKKEGDKIVLTLYEIKSASKVKPYHVVQASFYAFLLEELFKNTPVEVSRSIKIIFRQPQGYKIFEKNTADKRKLFNSFLQKAEDYLQTADLTPFVKFICVERSCQPLNECYAKAVKNLSISLFKSLKHQGQKLFQSAQVDTAKNLKQYISLLKQLQQPLGFEEEAFNTEYELYRKEGVACGLDGCDPNKVKAKQWGRNFLGTLLADNILYIDLLYGDVAPLGVILILLTPENSNLDLLYTNNPKIILNGVNIYPLVFDFSCQKFSYEGNVWRRFKQFFLQLLLFRRYPLSVVFRNEEAQKGLETLIYGELHELLKRAFNSQKIPSSLRDLMDVWRILKGIDYGYNIDKKLRVYILEELIGQIWQTNEPFNFKLPSFIAIAKLLKNKLSTFKGSPYKKFGCRNGNKNSLSEELKINLSEEKALSDCYHPLAPFRPSCIGLEEGLSSYKVDPKLWDYLILTGLWGLYDLFLGLKESSNLQGEE